MTTPYRLRSGGLFRCCTESLDRQLRAAESAPEIGTILTCEYCNEPTLIRAADGVWEWNRREE